MSRPGVRTTLRALFAPRRLVPMTLVAVSLVAAQGAYSAEPGAVPLAIAMCLAFLGIAPLSYRLLFDEPVTWPRAAVLAAIYSSIGVGVVSALGLVAPRWLGMGRTLLTTPSNLVVCVALFVVGGWGVGRDIGLEDRLRHEAARADRMARRAEEAQLLALRSHLDPHFLFNTLNAIAEWCVVDCAAAEQAVLQLSRMLRTILVGVRRDSWPLEEELALCDTLCELHRLRDPALCVRRTAGVEAGQVQLPPLLLLTLVENAIKHGPASGHRGEISFDIRRFEDRVCISVSNPGPYAGPRPGSQGLPTLERRLGVAYRERASLRIAGVGARTIAELDLPLSPDGAA
jgi:two-component system, LytTR family, sensor histidine kinase AlgZ